jgi:hypothetical protein
MLHPLHPPPLTCPPQDPQDRHRCSAITRGLRKASCNVIALALPLWRKDLCKACPACPTYPANPAPAYPPATSALSRLPTLPSRTFTAGSAAIRCRRRCRRRRGRCSLRFRRRRRGRPASRHRPRPRPDPPRIQGPPRAQYRCSAITSSYRGPSSDARTLSACSWSNALTRTRRATLATPRRTFVPAGSAAILPSCHRRRPLSRHYSHAFQSTLAKVAAVVGEQAGITLNAWMDRRLCRI